ncbi:MAG: DinB family protein [Thermoanaerobaculia bacterium]
MDLATLRRLFEYDAWANHETLASLRAVPETASQPLRLFAHVVAVEQLWLSRLRRSGERVVVWPQIGLSECEARTRELPGAWKRYFDAVPAEGLAERIDYVNSKGESWQSRAGDILMHVVMHSVYHRGQVAAEVRKAGAEPASTDFIHAVRQGYVP